MKVKDRATLLKLIAGICFGILLLNYGVAEPFFRHWNAQGERIDDLRKKVNRGSLILARERSTRARWAQMVRANPPADNSIAQDAAYKAVSRWVAESGGTLSSVSFSPWQTHDEGYETLECHVAANGDQISLGKFVYNLEVDPMPVNLEECELSSRDAHGAAVSMTARFTFMRLAALNSGKEMP